VITRGRHKGENSLYVYVSAPPRLAFSSNSMQLQWHDSVHLSTVYTDYSFSS